jgi:glycosyltransferase involved in cell wall biosynthesis
MKVCMLTRYLVSTHIEAGGMETYVEDLARGLCAKGHQVTIIISKADKTLKIPSSLPYTVLQTSQKVTSNPLTRFKYFYESKRIFKRLAKEQKIDLVHGQSDFAYGVSSVCQKLKIPLLMTVHGTTFNEFYTIRRTRPFILPIWLPLVIIFYPIVKRVYAKSSVAIAVSEQLRKDIIKQYNQPSFKIVAIPNGVDTEVFRPVSRRSARHTLKLLTAGRVNREKGIDIAIKAVAQLNQEGHDVSLTVAGAGPYLPELIELAAKLRIKEKVLFLGKVNREQMPGIYNKCDCFVFPTRREEGLPYAALESMSCGKYIIASKIGGISSVIEDGKNGTLIPAGEVEPLVIALKRVLKNPDLIKKISSEARKTIVDKFSKRTMVNRTLTLYQKEIE